MNYGPSITGEVRGVAYCITAIFSARTYGLRQSLWRQRLGLGVPSVTSNDLVIFGFSHCWTFWSFLLVTTTIVCKKDYRIPQYRRLDKNQFFVITRKYKANVTMTSR